MCNLTVDNDSCFSFYAFAVLNKNKLTLNVSTSLSLKIRGVNENSGFILLNSLRELYAV